MAFCRCRIGEMGGTASHLGLNGFKTTLMAMYETDAAAS